MLLCLRTVSFEVRLLVFYFTFHWSCKDFVLLKYFLVSQRNADRQLLVSCCLLNAFSVCLSPLTYQHLTQPMVWVWGGIKGLCTLGPKKFGAGSIFCVFASVACILIGKDEEYEKNGKTHAKISDSVCNGLNCLFCQWRTGGGVMGVIIKNLMENKFVFEVWCCDWCWN